MSEPVNLRRYKDLITKNSSLETSAYEVLVLLRLKCSTNLPSLGDIELEERSANLAISS